MITQIKKLAKKVPFAKRVYRTFIKERNSSNSSNQIENYQKVSGVTVLTDPLTTTAGHTIPIRIFLQAANAITTAQGISTPRIVFTNKKPGPQSISGDVLIINGISPLLSGAIRSAISKAVYRGTLDSTRVYIYLHEEGFVFDRIVNEGRGAAIEFISEFTVIPLTQRLKHYYECSRGWKCTEPVYNAAIHYPRSACPLPGSDKHINILTIASLQTRKGVDRIVQLAEEAERRGLSNVHFHWIGPHGKGVTGPLPESFPRNFTWWGAISAEHLQHVIPSVSCIILPSYSDPLPLSIWEAVMLGKQCFVSSEVGSSEIGLSDLIKVLDFSNGAAGNLDAILSACSMEPSVVTADIEKLMHFTHPSAFYARMAKQINFPSLLPLQRG